MYPNVTSMVIFTVLSDYCLDCYINNAVNFDDCSFNESSYSNNLLICIFEVALVQLLNCMTNGQRVDNIETSVTDRQKILAGSGRLCFCGRL